MLYVKQKKKPKGNIWYFISILVFFLILLVFSGVIRSFSEQTSQRQLEVLRTAIQNASVQCYALEGRYPPSVEYLEEHYGIVIDRTRYHVFYDGFASNLMPDITILPAESMEEMP